MTLIEEISKLKELEKKATDCNWTKECREEYDADSDCGWGREIAEQRDSDIDLLVNIRNDIKELLEVLGAFRKGDAEILENLAEYLHSNLGSGEYEYDLQELLVVRRLASAARTMEAKRKKQDTVHTYRSTTILGNKAY